SWMPLAFVIAGGLAAVQCGGHGSSSTSSNQPPTVDAGKDINLNISDPRTELHARVADDGLPAPAQLKMAWTKRSGAGDVSFSDPQSANTTATFTLAGIYKLRLTVNDGAAESFDDVVVSVGSDDGTFEKSVTQFGITWTFSQRQLVGHFANGDWWVVGPVKI